MDVILSFLLFSVIVVGLMSLFLWLLVPLAFPALGFGFWNAVGLSTIVYTFIVGIRMTK